MAGFGEALSKLADWISTMSRREDFLFCGFVEPDNLVVSLDAPRAWDADDGKDDLTYPLDLSFQSQGGPERLAYSVHAFVEEESTHVVYRLAESPEGDWQEILGEIPGASEGDCARIVAKHRLLRAERLLLWVLQYDVETSADEIGEIFPDSTAQDRAVRGLSAMSDLIVNLREFTHSARIDGSLLLASGHSDPKAFDKAVGRLRGRVLPGREKDFVPFSDPTVSATEDLLVCRVRIEKWDFPDWVQDLVLAGAGVAGSEQRPFRSGEREYWRSLLVL